MNTSGTDNAAALIEAARDIFLQDGIAGLSVRRVAERASCTTMAVYSHFGGKGGIVATLFDEGFEQLAQAQQAVDARMPPRQRVVALCLAYLGTARRYPHHYALMLGHFSGEHTPSLESSAKALSTLEHLISAVGSVSREATPAQAVGVAHALFALCHGWVSLERTGIFGSAQKAERAFKRAVDSLVRSLG